MREMRLFFLRIVSIVFLKDGSSAVCLDDIQSLLMKTFVPPDLQFGGS